MKKSSLLMLTALLIGAAAVFAVNAPEGAPTGDMPPEGEGQMGPPPYVGSPEFERLKAMAGRWEGDMPEGEHADGKGKGMMPHYSADIRVSANGSAIIERSFPGTPMEMVSVYHDRDGELHMTHYCAFGNQPQMGLTSVEDGVINLDLIEGSVDLGSPHMHSVSIAFNGGDEMAQTWSMYEEGAEKMKNTMTMHRVQ